MSLLPNKPFCRENYNANNRAGIDTALHFLNQFGYTVEDNGQKEAFKSNDCIVSYLGEKFLVECEKSNVWTDTNERKTEITVPYRKKDSQSKIYIMCNRDMNALIVGKMDEIKASEVREKWIYSTQMNEPFFFIGYLKFDCYKKIDGKWVCVGNNANILKHFGMKPTIRFKTKKEKKSSIIVE
jgi:hypothetical protein